MKENEKQYIGLDIARKGGMSLIVGNSLHVASWNIQEPHHQISQAAFLAMSNFLTDAPIDSSRPVTVFYETIRPRSLAGMYVFFFLLNGLLLALKKRLTYIQMIGLSSGAWRSTLQLDNRGDKEIFYHYFSQVWNLPTRDLTSDEVESALIAFAGKDRLEKNQLGNATILIPKTW